MSATLHEECPECRGDQTILKPRKGGVFVVVRCRRCDGTGRADRPEVLARLRGLEAEVRRLTKALQKLGDASQESVG